MCDIETNIKLTIENWDVTSNRNYHLEFLNQRNAIRAVLYDLLQLDNEIKCTNIEIQNLKKNFDSELAFLEDEVQRFRENEYLDDDDRYESISQGIKKIEDTNLQFSRAVEKYQLLKENKCQSVSQNVEKLFQLKSQFKSTHEKQVENLRRFAVFCKPDVRSPVEIRMKSIDRKFCDELFYMNSCEKGLKHIFSLIDDKSSHSGICSSTSSIGGVSDICPDFFTDFSWMRNEQIIKRTELFEYFMTYIAKDLFKAVALMHVRRPDEPIKFIANYLKHLKQNEFRMQMQEKICATAKTGESLFP